MNEGQENGWYVATWHSPRGKVCALAKREPFVNGHPIYEPGEVWFEFGDDESEALTRLKQSLPPANKTGFLN